MQKAPHSGCLLFYLKGSDFTNILDKAIATVAPVRAVKRAAARQRLQILNSGYGNGAANTTKKSLRGWLFGGGSHKEDIEDHSQILRERSRDLYMSVPLATGALKTCRTNVVGSGLKLKSQIDYDFLGISEEEARKLETTIEREFSLWADSPACDIERLDNFAELQQLAFLNWLMSGDVIVTLPTTKRPGMPYDLRVRLIEADRLNNPNDSPDPHIIGGVEVNDAGEVIAYHISSHHPLSWENWEMKWTRVEAYGAKTGRRNVLHVMNRERIGQRRGVPYLAPVIEALKQLGRYTDAELVAAVVSGLFAVFIQKDSPDYAPGIDGGIDEAEQVDAEDENSIELAPGSVVDLNEGEKANAVTPGRPNSNFDPFVVSICQQIGAALEIPFEILLKRFNSSFTAARGALLEFWKSVKMYRSWLASDFCQPIFEEFMCEAVAKGRISAPGFFADPLMRRAYCGAEWNGPAQGLLNPVQEVDAAAKRVENCFSTGEREAAEMNGSDFYRNVRQRRQENKALKEVEDIGDKSKAAAGQPAFPAPGAEQQPAGK